MAKDFVSSLGTGELNALMSMQVKKVNDVNESLQRLFKANGHSDFAQAYTQDSGTALFITARDKLLDELNGVLGTMDRIRAEQALRSKKADT